MTDRAFNYETGRNVDRPDKPKRSKGSKLEDAFLAEMQLYGIARCERQFMFHQTRRWRFDFAWSERKIALEIHGGIFMPKGKGGHNRGGYMEQSFEKYNEAQKLGWKVFIFGPSQVRPKKRTTQSSEALAFLYNLSPSLKE